MKRPGSLVLFGVLGSITILVTFTLIARSRAVCPASVSFVRYSQSSTSIVAIFQVTNRSAKVFEYKVMLPDCGETQKWTPKLRPAAKLGFSEPRAGNFIHRVLPACGASEVSVPITRDTNLRGFNVRLIEMRSRNWEGKLRHVLYRVGIRRIKIPKIPRAATYTLITPALPELTIAPEAEQSSPLDWIQPFVLQ